jgi:hypothetical protein
MYISLKDSCAKGFRKWADAHQPEMKNDLRASGSRLVSASPDQDSPVLTSLERPHHPWLVPGDAIKQIPPIPLDHLALQSPER